MFDYLRKHQKWLLILITIVVVVAFSVWPEASRTNHSMGASGSVMNGVFRSRELIYRDGQIAAYSMKLGAGNQGLQMLARMIGQPQPSLFPNSNPAQAGMPADQEDQIVLAGVNYRLIQSRLKDMGIEPSDKAVEDFAKSLPILAQPGAKDFLQDDMRRSGLNDNDITELFRVGAGVGMLFDLFRANLTPSKFETEMTHRIQRSGFSGEIVRFDRTMYLKPEEVTDEEIKKAYDDLAAQGPVDGGDLTVTESRSINYVLLPSPQPKDSASEEEKLKAQKVYDDQVNQVYMNLADAKDGSALAKAVASMKLTPTKTELFDRNSLPKNLSELGATDDLVREIFVTDKDEIIGNPVNTPKGYVLFHVTEVKAAHVKPLEAATSLLRAQLAERKAAQAALKAAGEAKEKWKDLAAKADEFKKAAKAAKAQVISATKVELMDLPPNLVDADSLVESILLAPPGTITDPKMVRDGSAAYFALVKEKFVFKDPMAADNALANTRMLREIPAQICLRNWMNDISNQAKLRWK